MISGKLVLAGADLIVNGKRVTGVFIQTHSKAIADVWSTDMYKRDVAVIIERRRTVKQIAVERRSK